MTPNPEDPTEKVLLSGVSANTTSGTFAHRHSESITYQIEVSGVTLGADIAIQHKAASGNWVDAHTAAATDADIQDQVILLGRYDETRAVISNYQDGTYTVSAKAAR